jgi:hypothetical protein
MAEAAGMKYVAVRQIEVNGALAYNVGDLVHESAVEGDGAWLQDGPDVAARPGQRLDIPPAGASQTAWADYAVSIGAADHDTAYGMTRDELIAAYGAITGQEIPPDGG